MKRFPLVSGASASRVTSSQHRDQGRAGGAGRMEGCVPQAASRSPRGPRTAQVGRTVSGRGMRPCDFCGHPVVIDSIDERDCPV